MSKWAPMQRFAERYEQFLPNHEWRPLFSLRFLGLKRYVVFVVRGKKK